MMCVRDCHRERVGGVWSGYLRPRKEPRDHRVDLRFFGAPGADNGFLYKARRVFADIDPGAGSNHDHDAARLAELQRGLRVLVDEHFLDCGRSRCMIIEQRFELVRESGKPARQGRVCVCFDLPVRNMREAITFSLDQSPAGRPESGVEAEDPQASLSSSSSGTS
jgi:hypothetical protein